MSIAPGRRLGPYEILAPIGAGGMGEVWKARDTRLKRIVAVKVLPADMAANPERVHRFEQEALAIAALNHPNIVAVYDVGSEDGLWYLVQELVEGDTLRMLIARGDLSLRQALDLAAQIADGLSAAHQAQIVHRDLKPDNVMVTRSGRAKILDFGIAKQIALGDSEATNTVSLTQDGLAVGTLTYMSPEQLRGQPADTRSDIFSFGVLLHEMLSGKRAFKRESSADTLAAILHEELPPLPAKVPLGVRQLVEHCVEKDQANRFQSTKDLAFALRAFTGTSGSITVEAVAAPRKSFAGPSRRAVATGAAIAASLLLGVALAPVFIPPPLPDLRGYRFTPLSREEATELSPQWSPGGKAIVYAASVHGVAQVFTREIGAVSPAQITHGEKPITYPIWSPDGSRIYYRSQGGLWSVGAAGGAPQLVLDNVGAAAVHRDGKTIAFARGGKLLIGPAEGPFQVYGQAPFPEEVNLLTLQFSPDGGTLAAVTSLPASSGRWALWIIPFPKGTPRRLRPGLSGTGFRNFSWFPDGRRLIYPQVDEHDNTSLIVLDIESNRERTVLTSPIYFSSLSVSPDGKRVALGGGLLEWNLLEISLPAARVHPMLARGGISFFPDWAPGGGHYLMVTNNQGPSEIVDRSPREGFTRRLVSLTTEGLDASTEYFSQPRWSPDGERFVFLAAGSTGDKLWVANAAGGRPLAVDPSVDESLAPAWSPDGRWVAYLQKQHGKLELAKIQPGVPSSKVILKAASPNNDRLYGTLQWSPGGDSILYPSAAGIALVSAGGEYGRALSPRPFNACGFTRDGKQVIGVLHHSEIAAPEWELYSVDVAGGAEKSLGALELPSTTMYFAGFSLSPSGDSFATSIAKLPFDIWMLEGLDQAHTWWDRLLRQ